MVPHHRAAVLCPGRGGRGGGGGGGREAVGTEPGAVPELRTLPLLQGQGALPPVRDASFGGGIRGVPIDAFHEVNAVLLCRRTCTST